MIHSPVVLGILLAGLVLLLMKQRWLKWAPVPFWCYFLPMLAATAGLIPHESSLYLFGSKQLLPVCLILLLIETDLPALRKLSGSAIGVMLAGCVGTMAGGLISFWIYRRWLPDGSWAAIGALTGSWTGGSANMLAVKEALNMPDSLLGPLVIVDAAVAYSWMALLIYSAKWETTWGKIVRRGEDERASEGLSGHGPRVVASGSEGLPIVQSRSLGGTSGPAISSPSGDFILLIGLSIALSISAQKIAQRLPILGNGFSATTWTILLVTALGLMLSATPLRKQAGTRTAAAAQFLLYLLLTTIGARADLASVFQTPVFLAVGLTWIVIHGLILFSAGRFLFRAPLGLVAAASQANIGGTVSAPMVGAAFSPAMATIGLLMAILGNLLGTYLGVCTALIARKFAG